MFVKRDRLQAGDLEIHLKMVLQIRADTRPVHAHIDPGRLQHLARTNARALQDLR